jgi:IMP cyclohydrolase
MTDIFEYLRARPYPGRGIILGSTPYGGRVRAYFIMGRSENSRNRVFEKTADGIRTRAFDESKMTDPSLIIYNPVRRVFKTLVVTNGDQTDTICEYLDRGQSSYDALKTRVFEPDAPNFTPRVSGVEWADGRYQLSILRTRDGAGCDRAFFDFAPQAGTGHFISTYEGFGSPLPSFSGQPVEAEIPDIPAAELSDRLWDALDEQNRVSLWVSCDGEEIIKNKNV